MIRALETIGIGLLFASALLLAPIWIPVGLVLLRLEKRRFGKIAATLNCARCGEVLGREAVALSDKTWGVTVRNAQQKHPGARLRMIRSHDAICTNCGLRYRYDKEERTLIAFGFAPDEDGARGAREDLPEDPGRKPGLG